MNPKTWFLLIVALVCGVGAAFCVKSIFFAEPTEQVADENAGVGTKERTLVAKFDLPSGTELTAQNVRFALLSESQIPAQAILSFEGYAGRKTLNDVKAGTPITIFDLVLDEETETSDASFIPPGSEVVPIEIQTAYGAQGGRNFLKTTPLDRMIKAGDVVDLAVVKEDLGTETNSSFGTVALRRPRLTTTRIVEGVNVFSVSDEKTFASDDGAPKRVSIVSVLLSAEQREIVKKASEEGKIKVLASGGDDGDAFDATNGRKLTSVLLDSNVDSKNDAGANLISENANFFSGASLGETPATQAETGASVDASSIEVPMNDGVAFPALDAAVAEAEKDAAPRQSTEENAPNPDSLDLISETDSASEKTNEESRFVENPLEEIAETQGEFDLNFSTNVERPNAPENRVVEDEIAPAVRFRERVPSAGVAEFVEVSSTKTSDAPKLVEETKEEKPVFLKSGGEPKSGANSKAVGSVRLKSSNVENPVENKPAPGKKFNYYSPFVAKTKGK